MDTLYDNLKLLGTEIEKITFNSKVNATKANKQRKLKEQFNVVKLRRFLKNGLNNGSEYKLRFKRNIDREGRLKKLII